MMVILRACIICVVLLASGCGGGGSGGGSTETGIRLLHAAIDAPPLELVLESESPTLLSTTRFLEPGVYAPVNKGPLLLRIRPVLRQTAAVPDLQFEIAASERRTVLIYGDTAALGLRTTLLTDRATEIPSGQAAVRLIDGVTVASALRLEIGSAPISVRAPFGTASDYVMLPAGEVSFRIEREADRRLLGSGSFLASPGQSYSIFAAGEMEYFTQFRILNDS